MLHFQAKNVFNLKFLDRFVFNEIPAHVHGSEFILGHEFCMFQDKRGWHVPAHDCLHEDVSFQVSCYCPTVSAKRIKLDHLATSHFEALEKISQMNIKFQKLFDS